MIRWRGYWIFCTVLMIFCSARVPNESVAEAPPNCDRTSVGIVPLTELGDRMYKNEPGGLYPGNRNMPPPAHAQLGLQRVQEVMPRNSQGQPDHALGRVVLLSIGMSNTTQEFQVFKRLADEDPRKHPQLVVVDGAQGAQSADRIAAADAPYWTEVDKRVTTAGVTAAQVQAVWLKQAVPGPKRPFPEEPQSMQGYLKTIVQLLKSRFPNLQLLYLSSRIYAGYATTKLNPEPHAFETAFAVRWLIEEQIHDDAALNCDPAKGGVRAPWLAWGPYLWADGLTPRGDGLIWRCEEFAEDGTHPAVPGRQKVAQLLLDFFTSDPTATPWFMKH